MQYVARVGLGMAVLVCGVWGCAKQGGIHLAIELPADPNLSPLTAGMTRLDLHAEAAGQPLATVSRNLDADGLAGRTIGFGDLDVMPGVRLTLLGYTASGRLVGFGRASAPIDVSAGSSVEVTVRLRRPFAYVAGGSTLLACDTTVEPGSPFDTPVDVAARAAAVATTPDGSAIVSVADDKLVLLTTTSNQAATAQAIALMPGASEIVVSPDSRHAIVVHASATTQGVSVVDLSAPSALFVPLAAPGAVAIGADTAWVLINPAVPGVDECAAQSKIVPLSLATAQAAAPIGLAGAARDLALSEDEQTIFVAEPCQNALVAVTSGGANQLRLADVPGPTQVAVAGNRVFGLGRSSTPVEHLVLASLNVDGTGRTPIDLAAIQELAKSNDLTEVGQTAEERLDADRIEAYSLSILPDGRNVALLVHGTYHADEVKLVVGSGAPQAVVPALDMETFEYQLVDVTTGVATQRLRTSCTIAWAHGTALLDDWACASAQGQDTAAEDFVAQQAAVLYGAK